MKKRYLKNVKHLFLCSFLLLSIIGESQLTMVSQYQTGSNTNDVFVVGNYAYIGDNNDLNILDISDITNPTSLAKVAVGGEVQEVFVEGDYAYVAALTTGLSIIDVSNPNNPALVSTIASAYDAEDVHVVGDKAYLANDAGLAVIDLVDPANPVVIGSIGYWPTASSITVEGNLAYVGVLWDGIKVVDISNPAAPVEVGSTNYGSYYYGGPGWAKDVQVHNDIVYFGDGHYGLYSFKLNNNMSLDSVGHIDLGYADEVFVDNNYVYSVDNNVSIFNTNASGNFDPPVYTYSPSNGGPDEVFVSGKYIFVGVRNFGLEIVEFDPPTTSVENALEVSELIVFPNPTTDEVTMILNRADKAAITLTDIQGKTVLTKTYHYIAEGQQEILSLTDFPAGVYTLQVNDGSQLAVQKVVKH